MHSFRYAARMPILHYFFALLVVLVWGANFVASKLVLEHFPPIFATLLRFIVLAPLILPFVRRPNKSELPFLLMLSVLGVAHFTLPQASLAAGLDIATCAIINQLCVPFACIMSVFFYKDLIGRWRLAGLLLAFIGITVVFGSPHLGASWIGSVYALGAAFFFATYSVLLKKYPRVTGMQILGYVCLFGIPQLALLSFIFESPSKEMFEGATVVTWFGLAYTILLSSIIGHGLWNYLMQTHAVSKIAPFSLLVPISGVFFGQMVYKEPITWELILGGLITLAGVAIIVVRRPKLVEKGDSL